MKHMTLALTLAVSLLQGCATVAVDRARGLSEAAIRYAEATVAVVDVAIDAALDSSSELELAGAPRKVEEAKQSGRAEALTKLDDELVKTVSLYTTLKNSINTTRAYFVSLQELANGSPANEIGEGVQSLARRVEGINQALTNHASSKAPKLDEATISALGGLAKTVATQVHGAIVTKALRDHAPMIGQALVLQERVLKEASLEISSRLARTHTLFYQNRVIMPYQTGQMAQSWVDDRRAALKVRALGQTNAAVNAAQGAAGQMQVVWQRILRGDYSTQEIIASLKDTEDLLSAVNMLNTALKTK